MNVRKLLAILCASLVLVGCADSMDDKKHGLNVDKPVDITLGTLEDPALEAMVDEFNSTTGKDRGINVVYTPVASTDGLANVDMVSSDYDTIYSLCASGGVAELSEYFSAMDLGSTYFEPTIESVSLSGLRAIPTKVDVNVLAIDQAAWETFADANGLDTSALSSWDGILSVAETYQAANDGATFLSIASSSDVALEMAYQLDKPLTVTSSSGAVIDVESDSMQAIWDYVAVPEIKGLYISGDYGSVQDGTTIATYCPISQVPKDDNVLVLEAPTVSSEATANYLLDTTAIAIQSTDDTTVYAGVVFIQWLTELNQDCEYALSANSLPANRQFASSNSSSLLSSYDVNTDAIGLATELLSSGEAFMVSPFDNVSTLKDTLETKVTQTSAHDTIVKRIQGGVLESKAYEGILDDDSFKLWYDDVCSQLSVTFPVQ